MFRSIQILRLTSKLDNASIRELFDKKSFKYKKKDKITGEQILLDIKVTDFKDEYNPKTIHIDFLFHFQFLIRREDDESDYMIAKEPFHVIIFPKEQMLVLLGSGPQRNQLRKFLQKEIQSKLNCTLQSIQINKSEMMSIFKNIQKESVRNNIQRPNFNFDRIDDFYKIEKSMYSAFANTCASQIKEFEFNKLNAATMDLSLRIVKCAGLIPVELKTHYVLNIVHDGRMSITVNVEPKQWAKFIYEKVYPIIK